MPEERAVVTAQLIFITELNNLRRRAGDPPLARLRRLSEKLHQAGESPLVLTRSTTSDVLAGDKRAGLPGWPWVASLVAACRAAAAETGLDPDALGSVAEWNTAWQSAKAAVEIEAGRGPVDAAAAMSRPLPPPAGSTGPARGAEEPETGETGETGDADAWRTVPPPTPTIIYHRYLEAFGRTGARLLRWAEGGDAEAAYRLAVLLVCEGRPQEAEEWQRAAADGDGDGDGDGGSWQRLTLANAVEAAFELGREYETGGRPHAALVFYERAGRRGHAEASYLVGLHYAQARSHWDAAAWFSRAALAGHPHARREYEIVHRQLAYSGQAPPMPDPVYRPFGSVYAPHDPYSLDSPLPFARGPDLPPYDSLDPHFDEPLYPLPASPAFPPPAPDPPPVPAPPPAPTSPPAPAPPPAEPRDDDHRLPTLDELLRRLEADRRRGSA